MNKITLDVTVKPWPVPTVIDSTIGNAEIVVPIIEADPEALAALADDWRSRLFAAAGFPDPTKPIKRERKARSKKADQPDLATPPKASTPATTTQPALGSQPDNAPPIDPDWLNDDEPPSGPRDDEQADAFKEKVK